MDPNAAPFIPGKAHNSSGKTSTDVKPTSTLGRAAPFWASIGTNGEIQEHEPPDPVMGNPGQSWSLCDHNPEPPASPGAVEDLGRSQSKSRIQQKVSRALDILWDEIEPDTAGRAPPEEDTTMENPGQVWSVCPEAATGAGQSRPVVQSEASDQKQGKQGRRRPRNRRRKAKQRGASPTGVMNGNEVQKESSAGLEMVDEQGKFWNVNKELNTHIEEWKPPSDDEKNKQKPKSYAVGNKGKDWSRAAAKELRAELEAVHAKLELEINAREREYKEKKKLEEIVQRLTEGCISLSEKDPVGGIEKNKLIKLQKELEVVRAKFDVETSTRKALYAEKSKLEEQLTAVRAESSKEESVVRMLRYRVETLEVRVKFLKDQLDKSSTKVECAENED